jgi:hypothetical protein
MSSDNKFKFTVDELGDGPSDGIFAHIEYNGIYIQVGARYIDKTDIPKIARELKKMLMYMDEPTMTDKPDVISIQNTDILVSITPDKFCINTGVSGNIIGEQFGLTCSYSENKAEITKFIQFLYDIYSSHAINSLSSRYIVEFMKLSSVISKRRPCTANELDKLIDEFVDVDCNKSLPELNDILLTRDDKRALAYSVIMYITSAIHRKDEFVKITKPFNMPIEFVNSLYDKIMDYCEC